MIHINELMVGNVVHTNGMPCGTNTTDCYEVIKLDNIDNIKDKKLYGSASIQNSICEVGAWSEFLEPVKITPNILIELGFKKDIHKWFYYILDDYEIQLVDAEGVGGDEGFTVYINNIFDDNILSTDYTVEYLHKLQNLIFIATNLHLNVKTLIK